MLAQVGVEMHVLSCCVDSCLLLFAVPERWNAARAADHREFYCPNGHRQHYPGPPSKAPPRASAPPPIKKLPPVAIGHTPLGKELPRCIMYDGRTEDGHCGQPAWGWLSSYACWCRQHRIRGMRDFRYEDLWQRGNHRYVRLAGVAVRELQNKWLLQDTEK